MQASLCLPTAGPNGRIHHCPPALCQASSVALRRHCQVTLIFSPVFRTGLRAGPGRMPINHAIRAHMTPPENGIGKKKAEEERRGTVKSVAAAVVLACTLGAMCTNWKARADDSRWRFRFPALTPGDAPPSTPLPSTPPNAPPSTPLPSTPPNATPSTPPKGGGDAPPSTSTTLTESIEALQAVLDQKCEPGTQKPPPEVARKLLNLLDKALHPPPYDKSECFSMQFKAYVNDLINGQKPDESKIKTLVDKDWSLAEYQVGLVLTDLLINQGKYEIADVVCQKLDPLAPPRDVRAKIRRAVVDMMLIAKATGSETLQRKMESAVPKLIKLIKDTQKNEPWSTTY